MPRPTSAPFEPQVLYEDNHLLVVDKPAGLATVGTTDRPSLYRWAGGYLKQKYNKPGNVFVGIVSRLDTVTSGVVVLARTSKGASRLSEQIRQSRMRKEYLAAVEGHLADESGERSDWLVKDERAHRMRVAAQDAPGAQLARLQFETLARGGHDANAYTLVRVELLTGRKHQIRVQMAAAGHPVWGDRKYGAVSPAVGRGIALHSSVLELEHPTRREPLRFETPPPPTWTKWV